MTQQTTGAADVTTPDRGTGHHIGEINTLDWQIREFARSLAEHRDDAQHIADQLHADGDYGSANHQRALATASSYRHALTALHIWTGGAYGERNTQ